MDLNLLLTLDVLLDERSVTRAARRVGLTQPALSRSLGRLRLQFDDPLLVRSGQDMVLTPRAAELREPLHAALHGLAAAVTRRPVFEPARSQRSFAIATADYGMAVVVPMLMSRLAREAPGVNLVVHPIRDHVDDELASGKLDAVICPKRAAPPGLIWSRLFSEDFACVVGAGHRPPRKTLSLDQFCSRPHLFVAPSGQATGVVDEALERLGRRRRIAVRVPSFLVAPLLVAGSDLVAVLARRIAMQFAGPFSIRVLEPPLPIPGFTLSMAWHERMRRDEEHAWFRRLVVETTRTA